VFAGFATSWMPRALIQGTCLYSRTINGRGKVSYSAILCLNDWQILLNGCTTLGLRLGDSALGANDKGSAGEIKTRVLDTQFLIVAFIKKIANFFNFFAFFV